VAEAGDGSRCAAGGSVGRILQGALTTVVSTPVSPRARVRIDDEPDVPRLQVRDHGPASWRRATSGGHGLRGRPPAPARRRPTTHQKIDDAGRQRRSLCDLD
jgi:hypothetical protein